MPDLQKRLSKWLQNGLYQYYDPAESRTPSESLTPASAGNLGSSNSQLTPACCLCNFYRVNLTNHVLPNGRCFGAVSGSLTRLHREYRL